MIVRVQGVLSYDCQGTGGYSHMIVRVQVGTLMRLHTCSGYRWVLSYDCHSTGGYSNMIAYMFRVQVGTLM